MNTKVYRDLNCFIIDIFDFKRMSETDLLDMTHEELENLRWLEWFNWIPVAHWSTQSKYQFKTREIVQQYRGW